MTAQPWTPEENAAVAAAYAEMLRRELAGEKYNKAAVNRELRAGALVSRSKGSVELKMMNASAVQRDNGRPMIAGYKPLASYQRRLFPDAILAATLGITR